MAQKQKVIPAQQEIFKWQRTGHKPTIEEAQRWKLIQSPLPDTANTKQTRRRVSATTGTAASSTTKKQNKRTTKRIQNGSKYGLR